MHSRPFATALQMTLWLALASRATTTWLGDGTLAASHAHTAMAQWTFGTLPVLPFSVFNSTPPLNTKGLYLSRYDDGDVETRVRPTRNRVRHEERTRHFARPEPVDGSTSDSMRPREWPSSSSNDVQHLDIAALAKVGGAVGGCGCIGVLYYN